MVLQNLHLPGPVAWLSRSVLPPRSTPAALCRPARRRQDAQIATATLAAPSTPTRPTDGHHKGDGHSALLQGLGEVGDVATVHVPWLLRLAHIRWRSSLYVFCVQRESLNPTCPWLQGNQERRRFKRGPEDKRARPATLEGACPYKICAKPA